MQEQLTYPYNTKRMLLECGKTAGLSTLFAIGLLNYADGKPLDSAHLYGGIKYFGLPAFASEFVSHSLLNTGPAKRHFSLNGKIDATIVCSSVLTGIATAYVLYPVIESETHRKAEDRVFSLAMLSGFNALLAMFFNMYKMKDEKI